MRLATGQARRIPIRRPPVTPPTTVPRSDGEDIDAAHVTMSCTATENAPIPKHATKKVRAFGATAAVASEAADIPGLSAQAYGFRPGHQVVLPATTLRHVHTGCRRPRARPWRGPRATPSRLGAPEAARSSFPLIRGRIGGQGRLLLPGLRRPSVNPVARLKTCFIPVRPIREVRWSDRWSLCAVQRRRPGSQSILR